MRARVLAEPRHVRARLDAPHVRLPVRPAVRDAQRGDPARTGAAVQLLGPAMRGVFPEVLSEMECTLPELRDALCVYAGDNCLFDNLVRFVGHAARNGTH